MTTEIAQGAAYVLVADFFLSSGGAASDVAGLTITVTSITDASVLIATTSTGIVHVSTGVYSYAGIMPASQAEGDYLVHWAGTITGSPVTADEVVTVISLAVDTWATASETLAITGTTVSGPTLAQAQGTVELHINRTIDAAMTVRDLAWCKRAVAWQAAWLAGQFGYTTRMNVTSVSQDGVSTQFAAQHAITLAPLAARAARNLSWMGTRSTRIRPRRRDDYAYEASYDTMGEEGVGGWSGGPDFTNEAADDASWWTPVGAGGA
jgi:hypothetical protein